MKYSSLFMGREDVYAVAQGEDYRPVHAIVTKEVLASHISGKRSVGLYLIRPPDTVKMLAIDIDRDDEPFIRALSQALIKSVPDTAVLVERTGGRGWHIWVFLEEWTEAKTVRAFMRSVLSTLQLPYPVEIYPRQEAVRKGGLGNLVRLPLGKHPRTGERGLLYNAFLLPIDIPAGDNDPDLPISPASPDAIRTAAQQQEKAEVAGSTRVGGNQTGPGALPCIESFQRGVKEGYRDEAMFRLAAYLHRQQIPKEAAWIVLRKANGKGKPPMPEAGLQEKLDSAYSGAGYGLPCSSDLVGLDSPFCDPSCPVYETAKGRQSGATGEKVGFPRIVERNGQYLFQQKGREGIKETVLSNFTMEVISRLEMTDMVSDDVLRVKVQQGARVDVMDISVAAFASRSSLIKSFSRAEYAWYGDDRHCQYLKSHLGAGELPTQRAITKIGRTTIPDVGDIWVMPNGIIAANSHMEAAEGMTHHRPQHFGTVQVSLPDGAYSKPRMKQVLRSLMHLNDLSVMVPVVGWAMATPHKPWFMGKLGHFPLLMLYGTRGAGKTQLVQRAIMPLFGYSSREPQIHFCDTTRFVLVSYGASTTTVPLFFDEYRPNALGSAKLRQLWDHWRHVYAGDTDHRGQADLSRLDFKQTSPIIVAGEELVTDPAMQERMIQVALSPDALTPEHRRAFQELAPMELASREFILASLELDPDETLDRAKEFVSGKWEKMVSPRVLDNMLVVAFGLQAWSKLTGTNITQDMRKAIFDSSNMVQQGATEEEGMRTPLWVDDFLLDVAAMVQEKGPFSWGLMEIEATGEVLYFNLRRAHAEWSKDMKARGEVAVGLEPIRRQLSERSSAGFIMERGEQRRMPGAGNMRVYKVDLAGMRAKIDR